MKNRVTWVVALLLVAALGVMVATVEARDRDDDAKAKHRDGPAIEAVALHHQRVHAAMETIEQLLDQELFEDARANLALAVNEPANAIVMVGPPELVKRLSGLLRELDEMAEERQKIDRKRGAGQIEHMRQMRERFGEDFERMHRGPGRRPGFRRGEAEEPHRRKMHRPEEMERRKREEAERRRMEERKEPRRLEMRRGTRRPAAPGRDEREKIEERERMHRMRPRSETFRFRLEGPESTRTPQPQLRKMIDELRRQMEMLEQQRGRMHREMNRGRPSSFNGGALHI
jgi:hypothetical protein